MHQRLVVNLSAIALGLAFAAHAAATDFPAGTISMREWDGTELAVTFDRKGGDKVTLGGEMAVEGKYKVAKEQVEFKDVKGPSANPDAAAGTDKWKLDAKKLTFTTVKDEFGRRASGLTSSAWEKQDTGADSLAAVRSDVAHGKERVTFKSGDLTLVGYLFRPAGTGPFPTLIWNHGSEPNPGGSRQFDGVASIFVPAGYAVFAPMRRGHSDSEGENIVTAREREAARNGEAAGRRLANRLLETSQLQDQLAGLGFARQLPFVDRTRLVVGGCSFGGIQALLGAEAASGYRAAISISPAALNWGRNPDLESRLKTAAERIDIPVFLIQPAKDASLGPARVLGPILERRNASSRSKIYPAEGPEDEQQHCFGGARGMHVWGADAVSFLRGVVR